MLATLCNYIRDYQALALRTALEAGITLRFIEHLVSLPYSFFQQRTHGDLSTRLGTTSAVREILSSALLSTVLDGLASGAYLVILLALNARLTIAVLALAGLRLALLAFSRSRRRRLQNEAMDNQALAQTSQAELLGGIETLKVMGAERLVAAQWTALFMDGLNISIRRARLDSVYSALLTLVGLVTTLSLTFYGAYSVIDGRMTLGAMIAFTSLATAFMAPLNRLVSSGLQLQLLQLYMERLDDVLESELERPCSSPPVRTDDVPFRIALEHISFRYGRSGSPVLDDASLSVPSGSLVVIWGRSGSGKSTLARLIAGLYKPDAGRVLFDDIDLLSLDIASVRQRLGFVTQDTQLFSGSIRSNIALRDQEASFADVVRAARLACVHDDIVAMPNGYDTPVTDRGRSLSGGQRQRIALARALLTEPRLLILDEATSNLDIETERRVTTHLSHLTCTRIVITHRPDVIVSPDIVVCIENGLLQSTTRRALMPHHSRAFHEREVAHLPRVMGGDDQ